MLTKMLVVLDDTEQSLNGLRQALSLARSENSNVELVSIVPPFNGDLRIMGDKTALNEQQSAFREVLDKALEISSYFNVNRKAMLLSGEAYEEIDRRVRKTGADLVVLNKKNPYHMDLIPIATVATRVIGHCEKDVLIMSKESRLSLDRVMLAYDNSENAKKAADKAIELALAYGSELTIASVYEVPLEGFTMSPDLWGKIGSQARQVQEKIADTAREKGVRKVKTKLKCGTTYLELIKMARELGAGLIMMGARRKSGIFKFKPGDVMERLICNGSIPVWVVNK